MDVVGSITAIGQIAGFAGQLALEIAKFINDARSAGEEIAGLQSKCENLQSTFQLVKAVTERREELAQENPQDQHDIETLKAIHTALIKSDHTVKKLQCLIEKVEGRTDSRMKRGRLQAKLKINNTEIQRIEKKIDDNDGYLRATLHCMEMSMIDGLHREVRSGQEMHERIIAEMVRLRRYVQQRFQEDQEDDDSPELSLDTTSNVGSTETSITVMDPASDDEKHTLQTFQQCVDYLQALLKRLSVNVGDKSPSPSPNKEQVVRVSSGHSPADVEKTPISTSDSSPRSTTSSGSERDELDRRLSGELIVSTECGDVERVKELLKNPSVGAEESSGEGLTALLIAARDKQIIIAKLLLERDPKANVHARDNDNRTALHHAVSGSHNKDESLILLLLKHGADINARKEEMERTPLHCCIKSANHAGAVVLIQNGADLKAMDKNGNTAAMLAVKEKRLELVKELQKAGAEFDMDNLGDTSQDIQYFLESCELKSK